MINNKRILCNKMIDEYEKQKQDKLNKLCFVSKCTPYYLYDRRDALKPITFSISYDGTQFTFTPDDYVKGLEDLNAIFTQPLSDTSLLRGVTKIMSIASYFTIQYSKICHSKGIKNAIKNKDLRFYFNTDKGCQVVTYIDYTNNMVYPDDKTYEPLSEYIFSNSLRVPPYPGWHRSAYMPKDVLPIYFYESFKWNYLMKQSIKDYFNDFLAVFKTELSVKLKCFKIKEQIDIPTKLVLYGVCNKMGTDKDNPNQGLVSMLYIEHKTSLDDYVKFKEICNEKLDEYLKPFNFTHDDIINITKEEVDEKFDTFQKIDKFMIHCGYLRDPRGNSKGIYDFSYIENGDTSEYSKEYGLKRWAGIKKYYPELWKGLKLILDKYIELKTEYDDAVQAEYNKRMTKIADDHLEYLINSENNLQRRVIKHAYNVFKNLKPIKVDDYEELINTIQMVNQSILDDTSKLYQEHYLNQIKEYKLEHPRAKKMEIVYKKDGLFNDKWGTLNFLKYKPFNFNYLPKEIKDLLNYKSLLNLNKLLDSFNISLNIKKYLYANGKQLHITRNNMQGFDIYTIENLKDAEETFEFTLVSEERGDGIGLISDKTLNNINDDLAKFCNQYQNKEYPLIPLNDFIQILNAFTYSPFKLNVKWILNNNFNFKPKLMEPLEFNMPGQERFYNWSYDSERSLDDIMKDIEVSYDNDKIEDFYATYSIVFDYENPQIIVDKLKEVECIKKAMNDIFEQP